MNNTDMVLVLSEKNKIAQFQRRESGTVFTYFVLLNIVKLLKLAFQKRKRL